ncbi:MAG TPA: ribokinase [Micromonosporaceae bacterium]
MAGPPRVVVVGSANIDLVVTAPSLPGPGETVLGRDLASIAGGKGANQAIAAARAGARCTFVGAVGSDAFGGTLRDQLAASGVDVSLLRVADGATGVALIVVDGVGENAIVVSPGANATLTALTDADRAAIGAADVLLCQLETPIEAVTEAARTARDAGTRVMLNAAPARDLPDDLVDAVDLLVVNQVEAAAMTSELPAGVDSSDYPADADSADVTALVDELLLDFPRVVLTRGAAGCWLGVREGDEGVRHVPAPVVDAVDTTAAGDAFSGAFAVAWGEGRDLVDAARWASAAGAVSVLALGASPAIPARELIDERYRATYRD